VLATNRAAGHEYLLLRRVEAGIVLTGPEVKSARARRVNLKEGFASIRDGQAFLVGVHFSPYENARRDELDPVRPRKLLLHAQEIRKLARETESGGMTLVPTRLYLKNGRVKVEIALARGKKAHDKRDAARGRALDREAEQERQDRGRRRAP
jgi:SsrA-binding protein